MHFLKINFFFYLSYWLRLLLIVCGDIESNPGPGSDRRVRVLYSNIRGLYANLDDLAVAGSDCDVLVCAELKSLIVAISQSSVSWLRFPLTEAEELHTWCLGYGSLCLGRIPLLPAEQVRLFLLRVLCVLYLQ